jgi:hypothetical protein
MSLDDPSKATLQPDYTISWEKLFKQLVKYILGEVHSWRILARRRGLRVRAAFLARCPSVRRRQTECEYYIHIQKRNLVLWRQNRMDSSGIGEIYPRE